jgi:hypothetical protein
MEPLMRLREYCETAACPRSGEFATEAPHFDFSSSALRQHRSACPAKGINAWAWRGGARQRSPAF